VSRGDPHRPGGPRLCQSTFTTCRGSTASALPGKKLNSARKKCTRFLSRLAATSESIVSGEPVDTEGYELPRSLVVTLALLGTDSIGTLDGEAYVEWAFQPTATPRPTPEPARAADPATFAREACAGSSYSNCEDSLTFAMEILPGTLVAICEYEDDQGDVVFLDGAAEAESRCSGDGLIVPSSVFDVLTLP
jgi:hypothetical protein